ncbi:PLDc N-terminal domain-containing protein [Glaciecola sp. 2405UD65-10]|uniref:PLDc N-terminal domain-containing protein n=1 Tax=Glaciecola sp. 2405UD65-10 TaxID=3397244 RepID=UPI003B5C58AC
MEVIFGIFGLFIGLFCMLIWFIPLIMIATSRRTTGGEKAAWILAVIFISWFAWIFYLLLAPLKRERRVY